MARLRVGIIGTGRKKERPDSTGFFMAYRHAEGYHALPDRCDLVACADIVQENADAFAASHGIPPSGVFLVRAIADTIDALLNGREPEVSGRRALTATEIIFAIYESSRRRARIDLPLAIQDHPLTSMVDAGDLSPLLAH